VPENLARFDAVVFNNTCAKKDRRDLFFDFLDDEDRSAELQENIISFVADGGGYVGIHGACCAFMGSARWEEMQGGSFAYHPAQQEVRLTLVEPDHPLSAAWDGTSFVHVDEPYILTNSFTQRRIRPLLYMDTKNMEFGRRPRPKERCYPAYIKPHGSGRVFYCSPSHNAQSFEDPRLLQFILDGIQYAVGDLACDDSPR
jgi:type 1 glutamine amidotransferase